jgi:hypothetical protein
MSGPAVSRQLSMAIVLGNSKRLSRRGALQHISAWPARHIRVWSFRILQQDDEERRMLRQYAIWTWCNGTVARYEAQRTADRISFNSAIYRPI